MSIAIIDTGSANLNSVFQAFKRLGYEATISSNIEEIDKASHLVLPGVGTACAVMDGVLKYGLKDYILNNKKPLLGICLGMQILATSSEEVPLNAQEKEILSLDLIHAKVKKLQSNNLRLPHMGWNTVHHTDHPLFEGIKQDAYFYFDHSFAMELNENAIGISDYGQKFAAAVAIDNFMGVQFHPEKSSAAGERLLSNFINNF